MAADAPGDAYDPKDDVKATADYFTDRYGDLENALKNFEADAELDLCSFEGALRKWGVKVDNVVELFGHIDLDWSGTISMQELFAVLALPMQEAKEHEEQRLRNEVNRIYEQVACSIRSKFGTITDYFEREKLNQGGTFKELSRARFAQLLRDLGLDLDATRAQRVFNHIDNNTSGFISMQELQAALNFNLVRGIMQDLAKYLQDKHGSATKALEEFISNAERRGSFQSPRPMFPTNSQSAEATPTTMPAMTPMASTPAAAGTPVTISGSPATFNAKAGEVTEAHFLGMLRRLEVIDLLKEETAKELYASLRPFSMDQLTHHIKAAEEEAKAQKKQELEEEKRMREKAKRDAKVFNSRYYAQEDLASWEKAHSEVPWDYPEEPGELLDARLSPGEAALPGGHLEDATRQWAASARAGASKAQLKDYITLLEDRVWSMEQDLDREQQRLQKEEEDFDGVRDYLGNQWQSQRLRASTDSPLSPSTPFTPFLQTPGSRSVGLTPGLGGGAPGGRAAPVSKEVKVRRAERLVQAASSGDVAGIQQLLSLRTDPNCAAWGGVTALMTAAHHGRQAALEVLLARHADLTLTDMHGRTAVDHARRRPAVREWLRACGGRAGRELAAEAEALARRVLLAGAERSRLEGLRSKLPSEEVMHQARIRRQLADPGVASQAAWPTWSPAPSGGAGSPQASPYTGSSMGATPEQRRASRPRKHVNIQLPGDARGLYAGPPPPFR